MTTQPTKFDRRQLLRASGAAIAMGPALAGCLSGTDSDESDYVDDEPDYGGWFDGADNYDGTLDMTGREEVTVRVGTGDDGLRFEPPAIQIDPFTTVVWEWTGNGGTHNVVHEPESSSEPAFESELARESGFRFEYTFNHEQIYRYYCEPHRDLGMRGAVVDIH